MFANISCERYLSSLETSPAAVTGISGKLWPAREFVRSSLIGILKFCEVLFKSEARLRAGKFLRLEPAFLSTVALCSLWIVKEFMLDL